MIICLQVSCFGLVICITEVVQESIPFLACRNGTISADRDNMDNNML